MYRILYEYFNNFSKSINKIFDEDLLVYAFGIRICKYNYNNLKVNTRVINHNV